MRHPLAITDSATDFRNQREDQLAVFTEQHAQLVVGTGIGVLSQNLHPRPVRRRAGLFVATAPHDQTPAILGSARECLGAAGFANAGFAGHEDEPTLATERGIETCLKRAHRVAATDEGIRGLRRMRRYR